MFQMCPKSSKMSAAGIVFVAACVAITFSACGDSGTTEQVTNNYTTGLNIVAAVDDLADCGKDNDGEQVFVKDESAIRVCSDGKWIETAGSADIDTLYVSRVDTVAVPGKDTVYLSRVDTVLVAGTDTVLVSSADTVYIPSAADYSCETKPLADSSGNAIYCGGDSIGVVYNGAVGAQGETGAGCAVASSTDTTVTVKCGDDSFTMKLNGGSISTGTCGDETCEIEDAGLSGVSQKGPFVNGARVSAYELQGNKSLKQTGRAFVGKITSDDGKFSMSNMSLVSSYVQLEAEGYYRNEVTGQNSTSSIVLNAYTDLTSRSKANVNLLTHLEYYRVNYLMATSDGTLKIRSAKKTAENEILASVFGVDASSYGYAEDLDVFGTSEGDAALLALSIMLQGDRSEADLTSLLSTFGEDIRTDGVWDGTISNSTRNWRDSIADWVFEQDLAGNLATFRTNVANWGLGEVPAFEKYIRKYYGTELGIGVCGDGVALGTVKEVPNKDSKYYASSYIDASNAGGSTRFICDGDTKVWREAANIEKDTIGWGHDFSEGDVRNGKVNTTITYVYENGNWRLGTSIDSLMYKQKADGGKACINTALNDTSKVKTNNLYYVCSNNGIADTTYHWVIAPTIYNDTYEARSKCNVTGEYNNGQIISGRVKINNKYTCDADSFRVVTDEKEVFLNQACVSYLLNNVITSSYNYTQWICETSGSWNYLEGQKAKGKFSYGGLTYETVGIGYQLWFAENLNYIPDTTDEKYEGYKGRSWCYDNSADSCAKYGRLYTWAAAMDSAAVFSEGGKGCGYGSTCTIRQPARGICPEGWHIPSDSDWSTLFAFVGGTSTAGTKLNSTTGWNSSGNGEDSFGFSVLPAGVNNGNFFNAGNSAVFWSSMEFNSVYAYEWGFFCLSAEVDENYLDKNLGFSVRCIKD